MSSPFTSKLGTNYCPQDDELAQIQTLLIEPTLRLKRLDDEIAELQRALDKLAEERAGLSAFVKAHRALLSPVRRLPLDIIQEIFIACLPTHRNCVMSAEEAPVLLGRICSSWRTISLSTPRLWCRLHIVEPEYTYHAISLSQEKLAQRLETTATWLGRSGQCALSISLSCSSHTDTDRGVQNLFLRTLVPFVSRWEHIAFKTTPSALSTLSQLDAADAPLLKSVAMKEFYQFESEDIKNSAQWGPWGLLGGSTLFRFSVALSNFKPLEAPLPWAHLRHLSISQGIRPNAHAFSSDAALRLLAQCPELRTCVLFVHDDPEAEANASIRPSEHILERSFLHTFELVVSSRSPPALRRFLDRLAMPELRHFKLRADFVADSEISYTSFLAATRLETFDINMSAISGSSPEDVCRGLPSTVMKVQIADFCALPAQTYPEILSLLSDTDSAPCCPGLQELCLSRCWSVSDARLLQFITSRMAGGRLKRVSGDFRRNLEFDIRLDLHPFIELGLRVDLTYREPPVVRFSPWQGLSPDDSDNIPEYAWTRT
ncbi:hypothetical protein FB451DRAFT_1150497 [Mycena latifolia]|nr:hypothetical protein FB451DRAFT_1150497 [Mycena latifolia]